MAPKNHLFSGTNNYLGTKNTVPNSNFGTITLVPQSVLAPEKWYQDLFRYHKIGTIIGYGTGAIKPWIWKGLLRPITW